MNIRTIACIGLLICLCAGLFFVRLGGRALWDPDEPRYAEAAYQMKITGDYLTPRFNQAVRFDKPPLLYWLIAGFYSCLGVNEYAARLPSAASALFLALACFWYMYHATRQRYLSMITAGVFVTMAEVMILGVACNTDMLLCLCITVSLLCFYGAYCKWIRPNVAFFGFYGGLGCAVLTKGPAGALIPLMIIGIFLLLQRQWRNMISRSLAGGIVLFLAIILPWYVGIIKVHGWEYCKTFFLYHNIARFSSSTFHHQESLFFYIPVLAIGAMPWTFFLFPALFDLKRLWRTHALPHTFLLFNIIWIGVVFVFFSLSKAKLATYILPLFLPIACIVGLFFNALSRQEVSPWIQRMTKGLWYMLIVGLLIGICALQYVCVHFGIPAVNVMILGTVAVILWGILVMVKKHVGVMRTVGLAIVLLLVLKVTAAYTVLPFFDELKSTKAVVQKIKPLIKKDDVMISWSVFKPSFVFYTQRPVIDVQGADPLKEYLKGSRRVFCLLKRGHYKDLIREKVPSFFIAAVNEKYMIISNQKD